MHSPAIVFRTARPVRDAFWDFAALRERRALPEECVRQGLLRSLERRYGYPKMLLGTEYALAARAGRADLIVWEDSEHRRPFAVVEIKGPGKPIDDDTKDQVYRYAEAFPGGAPQLVVLTNGADHVVLRVRDGVRLASFPTYEQAVTGKLDKIRALPAEVAFQRPRNDAYSYSRKEFRTLWKDHPEIQVHDQDVPFEKKQFFLEFFWMLLDESYDLSGSTFGAYKIVRDHGLRRSSLGNSSGGLFSARFRHLQLRTPRGRRQFYLTVSRNSTKVYGGRVNLSIIGGLDGRQSLQITSLGDSDFEGREVILVHKGQISLGEGGAIARDRVMDKVLSETPSFVQKGRLVCARLPRRRLSLTEARRTMVRLAALSDVLDQLRDEVREERRALRTG